MSGKLTRWAGLRRWMLAATAAGLAGTVATAQKPTGGLSPIDRARAYAQILDQKAEADVRGTLADAQKIAAVDMPRAVRRLREAIHALDLSPQITSEKRAELVALIHGQIDVFEGRTGAPVVDPKLPGLKQRAAAATQANAVEAQDVAAALAEIQKLNDVGRVTAAQARTAALLAKYPNNPSVIALATQGTYAARAADAAQIARETDGRSLYAMNDVQQSAIPANGNVEFPKNWAELTKAREEKVVIGPEEQAILRSLEKPVKGALNNAPFMETVQSVANLIGQEIYIDKRSLEDLGLDLQRPVNMPGNVSARTALRAILQSQGLTFVIKDKIIQVVTIEKARDLQITRAYYMGDLIQMSGPFGGAVTWGPQIDYQQSMANAQVVVDSIKSSVDPMIWKDRGGPGMVVFHQPTMSVIVRAPAEVHADLSGGRYKK